MSELQGGKKLVHCSPDPSKLLALIVSRRRIVLPAISHLFPSHLLSPSHNKKLFSSENLKKTEFHLIVTILLGCHRNRTI